MNMSRSCCWMVLLALGSLSAAPPREAEELVRRGNAAFAHGNYGAALRLYAAAEDATTDPGLVAFNKGVALYQLEHYAEAEAHFRCCREDAAGARRDRVLYNLGNSILQQAR